MASREVHMLERQFEILKLKALGFQTEALVGCYIPTGSGHPVLDIERISAKLAEFDACLKRMDELSDSIFRLQEKKAETVPAFADQEEAVRYKGLTHKERVQSKLDEEFAEAFAQLSEKERK